jgi:hypothetical protein
MPAEPVIMLKIESRELSFADLFKNVNNYESNIQKGNPLVALSRNGAVLVQVKLEIYRIAIHGDGENG